MNKVLLATAATMVAAAAPAYAQQAGGTITGTGTITYNNAINTQLSNTSSNSTTTTLNGGVDLEGNVSVDVAGQSISDVKQLNNGNTVVTGETTDPNTGTVTNGTAGNISNFGNVAADGNVGANSAAGYYNQQSNVGTLSVASNGGNFDTPQRGGWSNANSTAAQSTTGTYYGPGLDANGDAMNSSADRNTALVGTVGGAGNIGVNSAAGAFNSQSNITTLAIAADSSLAQSSAGIVQLSSGNLAMVQDAGNYSEVGGVTGAGNIGVNAASGVGNEQVNSMTVAASGTFGNTGGAGAGAGSGL